MHKSATKCNETLSKWCKNKHGASKIMDTLKTYQPSRSSGQWRRWIAMCSRKLIGCLGFSHRSVFIGEGASSGVGRGVVTHRGRGQGPGRADLLCGALVALLCLLFSSLEASVNFWMTGFYFVQFREYLLCNFSETEKQQKNRELALWRLVNRLVSQNT
jgi:hypothetical protein